MKKELRPMLLGIPGLTALDRKLISEEIENIYQQKRRQTIFSTICIFCASVAVISIILKEIVV